LSLGRFASKKIENGIQELLGFFDATLFIVCSVMTEVNKSPDFRFAVGSVDRIFILILIRPTSETPSQMRDPCQHGL
jgi:hypothetical protein